MRRLRGGSLAKATRVMRPQLDSGLPDPKAGLSPLLLDFVGWPVCLPLSPRRGLCIMLQSGCHPPHSSTYPSTIHPPPAQPRTTLSTCPRPSSPPRLHRVSRHSPFTLAGCASLQLSHAPLVAGVHGRTGEDPGVLGPGAGRGGGPSPPLAPPHTHTHGGRPRWRVPPQLSGAALGSVAPAAG